MTWHNPTEKSWQLRSGIRRVSFLSNFFPKDNCLMLKNLRRVIQNKHRGLLMKGVCLLHDNARPHKANITTVLLESFGWEVHHSAHSPDLVPSNFHLFLHLNQYLAGKRFETDKELEEEVRKRLREAAWGRLLWQRAHATAHQVPRAEQWLIMRKQLKNSEDVHQQCHVKFL